MGFLTESWNAISDVFRYLWFSTHPLVFIAAVIALFFSSAGYLKRKGKADYGQVKIADSVMSAIFYQRDDWYLLIPASWMSTGFTKRKEKR